MSITVVALALFGVTNVKAECDEWCRFAQGYYDAGGNSQYLERFTTIVLQCEGDKWEGYNGYNGYYTRAQFSEDSWYKVSKWLRSVDVTPDFNSPYVTGLGVGYWSSITIPSTQWGAWYGCPRIGYYR